MHHHKTYMYINFQQNRAIDQSYNRAHKCIRKKIASCINLQLPIEIFKNRLFQTCIIVKRTCISIFSKIGLIDQSKPCTQICFGKICNLQLEFQKITPFGLALSPNGHAGRFRDQSAC